MGPGKITKVFFSEENRETADPRNPNRRRIPNRRARSGDAAAPPQIRLPLTPIDQRRVERLSREAVSYRLPIDQVVGGHGPHQTPFTAPWRARWARGGGGAGVGKDIEAAAAAAAWWSANGMLSCGRSRLHSKGHEAPSFTRDAVSLRILQPPICLLPPWAAQDKPQHDGSLSQPSLVVSHDDSCSPFRRAGSAGTDHPASVGGGRLPTMTSAARRAVRLPVVTRRRATVGGNGRCPATAPPSTR